MRVEFLGTGGALTTPRPGCTCRVCTQARERGVPYSRTGPSVFVHGPDVLIDTPEESKFQLERAGIGRVEACLYSHWHPDHVMGRRVWEALNGDFLRWPPHHRTTRIYLPQQVAQDFREYLGGWEHFAYMQKVGLVDVVTLTDGQTLERNGVHILPFRVAQDYVYAFLFSDGDKRLLIAPDELYRWQPPDVVHGVDLAILPMGLAEFDPFTGARRIPAEHPVLRSEATFRQTLEMLRHMQPKRAILTHIEEVDGLSHDDLERLSARLVRDGLPVTFAYDTMVVEV